MGTDETGSAFARDLERFYRIDLGTEAPSLKQRAWLFAHQFGLHCVATYRFHRFARGLVERHPVAGQPALVVARALTYAMRAVHHVEIGAEVGPGFYIGHASSIFIGKTRIGRNFSVTHNVTVGVGHQHGAEGVPVIGDDVWVGTGSVIAGAIRLGDGATVANGSMVTRDVPDRALVVGNPARVVQAAYDNAHLMGARADGQSESEKPVSIANG